MISTHNIRTALKVTLAFISGLLVLSGCGAEKNGVSVVTDGSAAAMGKLHDCAACHGVDGQSTAEIFPNLAGQQNDYLVAQITAFRDHTRGDRDAKAYMWGVAAGLDDRLIAQLATYYSAQPPATGRADINADIAAGKAIYTDGIPGRDIPACATCHGDHAEGNGAMPRLAGQHGDYLQVQLIALSTGARDSAIMNPIAKALSPEEILAVRAYLSSL